MGSTLQNLFNPTGAQPAQSSKNTELYKVSYREGTNGVYKSIVRFVPFPQNTAKCVITKSITWLKNPTTGQGMYIDDPRSVGKYSPATELFFQMWNTQNPQWQKFAKDHLSTKEQHASLVQIIQDEQHPELVGQIKVFTYGKTIFDKLYAEEHPVAGVGVNPFHPIYGRYFSIVCEEKSRFNNFDKSLFFDNKDAATGKLNPSGLWYTNPKTNAMEYVTESSDQQAVADYLIANCPDLSKYDYQDWTPEQEKYATEVLAIIRQYFQSGVIQTPQQTAFQSNMQTLNTPAGMTVNNNPVFPGVTQTVVTPAMQNPTPVQPAAPTMGTQFGGVSMGSPVPPTSNLAPAPGTATISGIQLPNVAPASAPVNAPVMGAQPTIGDISSIISEL